MNLVHVAFDMSTCYALHDRKLVRLLTEHIRCFEISVGSTKDIEVEEDEGLN